MFNWKNNGMTFLVILLIAIGFISLFFTNTQRTTYENLGELSVNEADNLGLPATGEDGVEGLPATGEDEVEGISAEAEMAAVQKDMGYDGYLPNSSPYLVGEGNAETFTTDPAAEEFRQTSCWPKQQLTPAELLPQDYSSTWAQVHPSGQGSLQDRNFLQAGHHVGINTVGQTLRNANLQLRSEPPNPQVKVSPWIQSTIEPDTNRRYFEVGSC